MANQTSTPPAKAGARIIELRPIAEAAVNDDEEFGPCLLEKAEDWFLGYWNGRGWYCLDGDPLAPDSFGLLPAHMT